MFSAAHCEHSSNQYRRAVKRRPLILAIVAGALCLADAFWVYERCFRLNAAITHIGLDSVVMIMPASAKAAELRDGRWDINPLETTQPKSYGLPAAQNRWQIAFVSLGSRSQYGRAVAVIRDLKARHICHVALREGATRTAVKLDFGKGPETSLEVPTIVLCGDAYGDGTGFVGPLTADHDIHLDAGDQISSGS